MNRPPRKSTLFPSPTLSRSLHGRARPRLGADRAAHLPPPPNGRYLLRRSFHKLEPAPAWLRRDMLDSNPNSPHPNGPLAGPFLSIFEHSRIPMALVDSDRRYVTVNDALVDLYEYPRSQLVGSVTDRMGVDERSLIDERWEQLVRTNQLYGERVVEHANGTRLRVTYAAHA